MKKPILSLALCMIMALTLLPTAVFAAEGDANKTIMLGTDYLAGGQVSSIYFGRYQQTSLGSSEPENGTENVDWIKSTTATQKEQGPYYGIDPIKWRLLENSDGKLFLTSNQNLDVFKYHNVMGDTTWETSAMRS